MYERRSRLSQQARDRLLEHLVAGTTARAAAALVGVHRNTAAGFYTRRRHVIAEELATASPVAGEVEVDESDFGGVRKGQRGRGAAGKVPVFGLFKRGGKVDTVVIPNVRTATRLPIIERMIRPDSIVSTDGFRRDAAWMSRPSTMCGSPMRSGLGTSGLTSMGSRISGTRRSGIGAASTAAPSRASICS